MPYKPRPIAERYDSCVELGTYDADQRKEVCRSVTDVARKHMVADLSILAIILDTEGMPPEQAEELKGKTLFDLISDLQKCNHQAVVNWMKFFGAAAPKYQGSASIKGGFGVANPTSGRPGEQMGASEIWATGRYLPVILQQMYAQCSAFAVPP